MNIALRKLALIEQNIIKEEEKSKIEGYSTVVVDNEFKKRIVNLMDRIRSI